MKRAESALRTSKGLPITNSPSSFRSKGTTTKYVTLTIAHVLLRPFRTTILVQSPNQNKT